MTREKFLHEVIIRLSDPDYINRYARNICSNWKYSYTAEAAIDVIAKITSRLINIDPEMDKIVRNNKNAPFDGIVLFFYEKSYERLIENRFDL